MQFLRTFCPTLLTAFLASSPAVAAITCDGGVDQSLTEERRHEYTQLVATALSQEVTPAQVDIYEFMQSGEWSAVYVATPVADDGVLFFVAENGQPSFKDVWGGWAEPSERPELVEWAKNLGAPDNLARCFARIVTE